MRAFAITWDGAYRNIMVAAAPDLAAARAAVDGSRSDGGIAVGSAVDLDFAGPALVSIYNGLKAVGASGEAAEPVKRFTTRADGQRRIFEVLEAEFKNAPEVAAPSTGNISAETETNDEDAMTIKGKKIKKAPKAKVAKAPREKKVREPRAKKDRNYKDEVVSKGSAKRMEEALALVSRKMGATADEIKEKLGVSLGTAKNLVWYLRRAGNKIVVGEKSDAGRRPYVIA